MNTTFCQNTSDYALCLDEVDLSYSVCPDLTLCNNTQSGGNVGLAFGLTIGAGLATTLGALLPFVPFIKRSNTRFLAIGLGLAAGVMLYVSFTEIWKKSRDYFCCVTPNHFELAVTACFFGGIIVTVLLDLVVAGLQRLDCGCCALRQKMVGGSCLCCRKQDPISAANHSHHLDTMTLHDDTDSQGPSLSNGNGAVPINFPEQQSQGTGETDSRQYTLVTPDCASVSANSVTPSDNTNNYATASVNELFSNSSLLRMNAIIPETTSISIAEEEKGRQEEVGKEGMGDSLSHVSMQVDGIQHVGNGVIHHRKTSQNKASSEEALGPEEFREVTEKLGKSTKELHRMGILTALAIGIHNFPEGLATFVAALSSPSLGAALAVAIALHNIPEGLCVAMPVYYATGSRWKGFLWAFLSGISEPFGALLGWVVLRKIFGPLVYGIAFGFIAGMMVFISLKELLPTAYRFDTTHGKLVSGSLVVGMLVMAASLLLFLY